MTEQDKQLLLQDLCARLPYFVYIQIEDKTEPEPLNSFMDDDGFWFQLYDENGIGEGYNVEQIKPYLRPMSSMTEEEKKSFQDACKKDMEIALDEYDREFSSEFDTYAPLLSGYHKIDWLNSHHFDYRNLIEKGLALPAPENMYKID